MVAIEAKSFRFAERSPDNPLGGLFRGRGIVTLGGNGAILFSGRKCFGAGVGVGGIGVKVGVGLDGIGCMGGT